MGLGFADLKTIIISLITGIGAYFLSLAIHRYWSNRSIKSMRRRIEENEAYKANLNNLAKSDRALLIRGFEGVFALLCLMNVLFALQPMLVHLYEGSPLNVMELAVIFLWLLGAIVSIGLLNLMRDVSEYPTSTERIDKIISKLKAKFLGDRDDK
jgi:hypothetical protein